MQLMLHSAIGVLERIVLCGYPFHGTAEKLVFMKSFSHNESNIWCCGLLEMTSSGMIPPPCHFEKRRELSDRSDEKSLRRHNTSCENRRKENPFVSRNGASKSDIIGISRFARNDIIYRGVQASRFMNLDRL
jgi:hypothetical protein